MVVEDITPILVVEYPKSGGTWVTSLLGDALQRPKRDVYVNENYKAFDVRKHPWYRRSEKLDLPRESVIKSHELPGTHLHPPNARIIHLVRDGRDVIVSKYFYERDFCVKNGIYEKFDIPFEIYVRQEAKKWREFVLAWQREPSIILARYEDFLKNTEQALQTVIDALGLHVSRDALLWSIEQNDKERWKKALADVFTYNTFVRKATSGDWRTMFTKEQQREFMELAGDALHLLGYS
jgi:hypothetical protein